MPDLFKLVPMALETDIQKWFVTIQKRSIATLTLADKAISSVNLLIISISKLLNCLMYPTLFQPLLKNIHFSNPPVSVGLVAPPHPVLERVYIIL